MTQTTRDGRYQQGECLTKELMIPIDIDRLLDGCSALPVPDAPSSPPASPLYSYQVSGTGQEFFFAVTR